MSPARATQRTTELGIAPFDFPYLLEGCFRPLAAAGDPRQSLDKIPADAGNDQFVASDGSGERIVASRKHQSDRELEHLANGPRRRQSASTHQRYKFENNWAHYTPDGKSIIYQRSRTGGEQRLWKMPADGGASRQITSSTCTLPAVSERDGSIACWYTNDDSKPEWQIGIFSAEGGRPLKTFPLPLSVSVQSAPRWSPNGRAVHY